MDIDLLFTEDAQFGLVANSNFIKKVAGVTLSAESHLFTLEKADMDYKQLNIPIDPSYIQHLQHISQIHIGAVKDGQITQAYQVPLLLQENPYGAARPPLGTANKKSLSAFKAFVSRCRYGQPVHRDELGNEDSMGCILKSAAPAQLDFAPHLAQRHSLEQSPTAAPRINAPGLGLGGSGGGRTTYHQPTSTDWDDED